MMSQWLGAQLALPTGIGGWLVGRLMNRWNAAMNDRAVALLGVQPGNAVLEVGFGGGATIHRLYRAAPDVHVTGLERSPTLVAAAGARLSTVIAAQRVAIDMGDVHALPYADQSFDRVMAVNVHYFWVDVPAAFREIARVLRPAGTLVLGYRPAAALRKAAFAKYDFQLPDDEALLDGLHRAGLEAIALECGTDKSVGYCCLVATRHD